MKNCQNCNSENTVTQAAHEVVASLYDRANKRLWIALVLLVIMLAVSNLAWLYAWMQYDYASEEIVTVDGKDGIANYIGNDGEIYNGKSDSSESKNANP